MILRRQQPTGILSRGSRPTDYTLSVFSAPAVRVLSAVSTIGATIKDAIFTRNVSATVVTEAAVEVLAPLGAGKVYTNLTPSVATFDTATRRFTRITDGTASLLIDVRGERRRIDVPISQAGGATADVFSSFVTGSMARGASDAVESRIAGKTPSASTLNIYSAVDHATGNYTRSASLWCADLHRKYTAASVWNSKWGQAGAGTLITPQHVVGATHYGTWADVGNVFRWVDESNVTHTRTVVGVRAIPDSDITIALLNSPLPATIYPALVPPVGWTSRLGSLDPFGGPAAVIGVPCFLRNQFGEARAFDLVAKTDQANGEMTLIFSERSMPAQGRFLWYRLLVAGDSGGPAFMEVGDANRFMLITLWGASHGGFSIARNTWASHIAAIDAAAGVSTGFLPTVANLSAFPTY